VTGRVVAELGRPETPEETADRKAAASKAYRSSQTVRNLIAALLVSLGLLVVIVFAVPRGTLGEAAPVDLAKIAAEAETAMQRPVIVAPGGDQWRVNDAVLKGGPTVVWEFALAPTAQADTGFARVAQAFDQDSRWAPLRISGTAPSGEVNAGGYVWDEYVLRNPESSANVSYALGTQAGRDYVLVFGSLSKDATKAFAASLASELDRVAKAQP
jgi:hypothetical protein